MPYTAGPTLAALGQADKLSTMESPLEAARKRRRERLEDVRAERALRVDEKKQEHEEKVYQAEQDATAARLAKRKAMIESLPPKPLPDATPEENAAWYVQASTTAANAGFLDIAEEFRNIGKEAHSQQVVSPVDIASTRVGTEETRRELDAGIPEETAENLQSQTELNRAKTAAGGFAPTAGSKPRTTAQLLDEDKKINDAFSTIFNNEIEVLEYDDDGQLKTPISIDNREYLRDMYSMDVKDHGPDRARDLLRNNLTFMEVGQGMMDGPHEAYLMPKAWQQDYQEQFALAYGRAPTKEETIKAWIMNLGQWKNDQEAGQGSY